MRDIARHCATQPGGLGATYPILILSYLLNPISYIISYILSYLRTLRSAEVPGEGSQGAVPGARRDSAPPVQGQQRRPLERSSSAGGAGASPRSRRGGHRASLPRAALGGDGRGRAVAAQPQGQARLRSAGRRRAERAARAPSLGAALGRPWPRAGALRDLVPPPPSGVLVKVKTVSLGNLGLCVLDKHRKQETICAKEASGGPVLAAAVPLLGTGRGGTWGYPRAAGPLPSDLRNLIMNF